VLGLGHELQVGGGTTGITARASARMGTEIGARIAEGTAGGVSETGVGGNAGAPAVED
jgi:hypothetical protein